MRNRIYMSSSSDRIPIGNKAPNGYILYRNILIFFFIFHGFSAGVAPEINSHLDSDS
jgi:hypothetical protein